MYVAGTMSWLMSNIIRYATRPVTLAADAGQRRQRGALIDSTREERFLQLLDEKAEGAVLCLD